MKQGYKDIISHARQTGLIGIFPSPQIVSDDIPQSARTYLQQAVRSISTPDGAVLLAGSAVDAMLKAKNLVEGSLNYRINLACDKHLITSEMAEWAHSVRLEANGVRHADMKVLHHTRETAARAVEFANALGEFMFVLPARIQRGRSDAANPIK